MPDLAHIKRITPGFWAAIAGAIVAGATVLPDARVLGGLVAGGAMFFVAVKLTPCCDGCAQGAGCGGDAPAPGALDASQTGNTAGLVAGLLRDADVARNGAGTSGATGIQCPNGLCLS